MAKIKHCIGKAKQSAIIAHTTYNLDDGPQHFLQIMNSKHYYSCTCKELGDFQQLIHKYFDDVAGYGTMTGYFIDIVKSGDKILGITSSKYATEGNGEESWQKTLAGN